MLKEIHRKQRTNTGLKVGLFWQNWILIKVIVAYSQLVYWLRQTKSLSTYHIRQKSTNARARFIPLVVFMQVLGRNSNNGLQNHGNIVNALESGRGEYWGGRVMQNLNTSRDAHYGTFGIFISNPEYRILFRNNLLRLKWADSAGLQRRSVITRAVN